MKIIKSLEFDPQPGGIFWRIVPHLVEKLVAPLIRTWGRTARYDRKGLEHLDVARREGGIIVSWHDMLLTAAYVVRDRNIIGLVSPVWEGEIIARLLKGLGFGLIRGSSIFSPTGGLRTCVRRLKQGEVVATILDGPQGPPRVIKNGAIYLAALSGRRIFPMALAASPSLRMPSWDRHLLALPFSRIAVRMGEGMYVPREVDKAHIVNLTGELGRRMVALEREALGALHRPLRKTHR